MDIKGYFDAIDHARLLKQVRERIADGRVLDLIEAFLRQGVMEGTDWTAAKAQGTPQGGVISPLLANVYLDPLDWEMAGAGLEMVRYADDMVVLCRSEAEARAALERVRSWMAKAGLELHPEKTRRVDMKQAGSPFDFLGYRFVRSRRGRLVRAIRPKSLHKLRASLKPRTRRANGRSLEAIVTDINRTLRGWFGHFQHAEVKALAGVDGWIRGRLRAILRKRHRLRGRSRGRDHQRWPNRYFTELGLFCLLDARAEVLAGLRGGATP